MIRDTYIMMRCRKKNREKVKTYATWRSRYVYNACTQPLPRTPSPPPPPAPPRPPHRPPPPTPPPTPPAKHWMLHLVQFYYICSDNPQSGITLRIWKRKKNENKSKKQEKPKKERTIIKKDHNPNELQKGDSLYIFTEKQKPKISRRENTQVTKQ